MEIKDLVKDAHRYAQKQGWWGMRDELLNTVYETWSDSLYKYSDAVITNSLLMLVVSELAEATEALRCGNNENLAEELADAVIRIADFCGGFGIDLESAIEKKMEANSKREYKHGGKII